MKTLQNKEVYWITSDRFDIKPDKSSWTEMATALADFGANVHLLTSYEKQPYTPADQRINMVYLKAINLPLIYRLTFLFNALIWLLIHGKRDGVVIVNQDTLQLFPLLKLFGFKNRHFDVRTLPVLGTSTKDKIDHALFWRWNLRLNSRFASSYSFITERLKQAVEQEFKQTYDDYCIWESGVNSDAFAAPDATAERDPEAPITLFYHGSIFPTRGVNQTVEAVAKLVNEKKYKLRFVIVGGGLGTDDLKATIAKHDIGQHIDFQGFLPYEEIPNAIARADICTCPLPDRDEWNVSSPLKVFEYMAAGKPLLLTRIPAHLDVAAKYDFIAWSESANVDDLCHAIEHAIEHLESLSNAAKQAPDAVKKRWDWKVHGRTLANHLTASS